MARTQDRTRFRFNYARYFLEQVRGARRHEDSATLKIVEKAIEEAAHLAEPGTEKGLVDYVLQSFQQIAGELRTALDTFEMPATPGLYYGACGYHPDPRAEYIRSNLDFNCGWIVYFEKDTPAAAPRITRFEHADGRKVTKRELERHANYYPDYEARAQEVCDEDFERRVEDDGLEATWLAGAQP
jgi:hypothetical protein